MKTLNLKTVAFRYPLRVFESLILSPTKKGHPKMSFFVCKLCLR